MMLCIKAAICCHRNESFADLKEDNENKTQLPLTAPSKTNKMKRNCVSIRDYEANTKPDASIKARLLARQLRACVVWSCQLSNTLLIDVTARQTRTVLCI